MWMSVLEYTLFDSWGCLRPEMNGIGHYKGHSFYNLSLCCIISNSSVELWCRMMLCGLGSVWVCSLHLSFSGVKWRNNFEWYLLLLASLICSVSRVKVSQRGKQNPDFLEEFENSCFLNLSFRVVSESAAESQWKFLLYPMYNCSGYRLPRFYCACFVMLFLSLNAYRWVCQNVWIWLNTYIFSTL